MPESDAVPNELFRDARVRLFGSRQALAEAVNTMVPTSFVVSENDIGKLERGEVTWPREPRRTAFRKALQAGTDQQIGLFDRRRQRSINAGSPGRSSPDIGPRADAVCVEGSFPARKADANEPRPALLTDIVDGTDLVSFATVLEPSGIGAAELTAAELACDQLDRDYPRMPPDTTLTQVRDLMTAVIAQLSCRQTIHNQQRLVTLAARLSGLRAWGCFDVDEHRAAGRWFELSVSAAQEAQAWSVGAWLLGAQSLIPWHRRDFRGAADLIERGIYHARHGSDETTRAWLYALQARARAATRDRAGFERSYARAQEAAEYSTERDRRHGMDFDQGILDARYYAGSGWLLLQQPEMAEAELSGSLQALPQTHSKARAVLTLSIADAAVQSDQTGRAVELAHSALTSATHQPILPILQQARRIQRSVAKRDPRASRNLDDPIAEFAAALATVAAGATS
ncbi:hypothetical protein [Actinoplanes aureus]|uniref:Uncharacterized protein n=1 Tax=Actinoplanes aureus TaxID=2792083 RepID=A0A931CKQ7_9ACTN|nr:hypothetical protein [Actinoplanes aureus]MBG0569183.1 hypothetical protein [Actinoplanes aureus]